MPKPPDQYLPLSTNFRDADLRTLTSEAQRLSFATRENKCRTPEERRELARSG